MEQSPCERVISSPPHPLPRRSQPLAPPPCAPPPPPLPPLCSYRSQRCQFFSLYLCVSARIPPSSLFGPSCTLPSNTKPHLLKQYFHSDLRKSTF